MCAISPNEKVPTKESLAPDSINQCSHMTSESRDYSRLLLNEI